MLVPVSSTNLLSFPSTDSIVTLKIGIDCFFFVPVTVKMWCVWCPLGFNYKLSIASLETNFLPEPLSKYAQNVVPFIFIEIIAGRDFSSFDGENLVNIFPLFRSSLF